MGITVYWIRFHQLWINRHSFDYNDIQYHPLCPILILVLDAYLPVSYEALLLVNAFKQIFAFGFSYGIVPWVTLDGFKGAFGAMCGIQFAIVLLGLPLWYYGKQIRHTSAAWKVIIY
jgi:hypothetical protein